MTLGMFESLAPGATRAVSRRTSLLAVAGAMSATANSDFSDTLSAKKGNKSKSARKQCRRQVPKCEDGIARICDRQFDDPETIEQCITAALPCCDALADCDATAMLRCILGFGSSVAASPGLVNLS